MLLLTRLRRHDAMRKLGKRLEKGAKSRLYRLLVRQARSWQIANQDTLSGVRRVLLIRPNFRIGNAVIGARFIDALARGRPDIEIDYLGTDTTQALFAGMPLTEYHALSRSMLLRPWRLTRLLTTLRRRKYDLAIQVGEGSVTSWVFTQLCGAQQTLGQRGRLEDTYDWVSEGKPEHAHELACALAAPLGLACEPRPWLVVSEQERADATARLAALSPSDFSVGIFIGGHLDKRLPLSFWQAMLHELDKRGVPHLVLLGPEESAQRPYLEQACGHHGRVLPPRPLREFIALLANLPRLITPDTGPMHMAAALGVPVVALLNVPGSYKFAPRSSADLALFQPEPTTVARLTLNSLPSSAKTVHALYPKPSQERSSQAIAAS